MGRVASRSVVKDSSALGVVMEDRLHLGAFNRPVPGWLNTDITPHIFLAKIPFAPLALRLLGRVTPERLAEHRAGIFRRLRYLNAAKCFPFPSQSVSAIYTSHMLEHLYPWHAETCLRECLRVLKPDGVLRIAVPDLEQIVARFESSHPAEFLRHIFEYGHGLAKNSHRWHYTNKSLCDLLIAVGFRAATTCSYRQGCCPDLYLIENRPDSLFVEAVR
jgi:SAM-dependent methyltransferase